MEWGIIPELRQFKTASVTSSPMVGQNCWKNNGGIPSGPRAFKGFIYFKAKSTSLL